MAEIKISCEHCGQRIAFDDSYRGMQIDCPSCQRVVFVPTGKGRKFLANGQAAQIIIVCVLLLGCVLFGLIGNWKSDHNAPTSKSHNVSVVGNSQPQAQQATVSNASANKSQLKTDPETGLPTPDNSSAALNEYNRKNADSIRKAGIDPETGLPVAQSKNQSQTPKQPIIKGFYIGMPSAEVVQTLQSLGFKNIIRMGGLITAEMPRIYSSDGSPKKSISNFFMDSATYGNLYELTIEGYSVDLLFGSGNMNEMEFASSLSDAYKLPPFKFRLKSDMNQENERQRWREGLFQVFASEGHGREKCKSVAERYDQLTENGLSSSSAVGILLAAYSSTDAKTAHTTIKSWVESELEQFNATHQGIDTNGKSRLKKAIQTLNANIDKCCVLIDGQPLSSG